MATMAQYAQYAQWETMYKCDKNVTKMEKIVSISNGNTTCDAMGLYGKWQMIGRLADWTGLEMK
jgi:hypothetical protein